MVTAVTTGRCLAKLALCPAGAVETGVTAAREGVKQAPGQAGGINVYS